MIDVGQRKYQLTSTNVAGMQLVFKGDSSLFSVNTLDKYNNAYKPTSMNLVLYDSFSNEIALDDNQQPVYSDENKEWETHLSFNTIGSIILRWKSSDNDVGIQMCAVIDARLQYLMFLLKSLVDKSVKDSTKTYGYTDVDLFIYLVAGLNYFNTISPVTYFTLGSIPAYLESSIMELSSLYAVQAQMMFAIDTDVTYNDQGLTLSIDHFTRLNSVYTSKITEMTEIIKRLKWTMGPQPSIVMAFSPERARAYMFPSQVLAVGFPYFAFPSGISNVLSVG